MNKKHKNNGVQGGTPQLQLCRLLAADQLGAQLWCSTIRFKFLCVHIYLQIFRTSWYITWPGREPATYHMRGGHNNH